MSENLMHEKPEAERGQLADWLWRHQRSILLLLLVMVLGGGYAALNLPVTLFPNIDFPRIMVSVDSGDRPAERMTLEVTQPLERSLRQVPGVRNIRSTTSRGAAELSLSFAWGTNMVTALLQADLAINRSIRDLPPGTRFTVRRLDTTIFPMFGLSLTSHQRDTSALRDFATYEVQPLLAAVPGVAQVEILGGTPAEYHIILDPARLQSLGLTPNDIGTALAANNVIAAVGRLEDYHKLYLVLANAEITSLDALRSTVVKTGKAGQITLGALATIERATEPSATRVTADGTDAVLINIRQQPGANAIKIAADVQSALAALKTNWPADIKRSIFYDQSELVRDGAVSVRDAIIIGALLAALVLFLFLRNGHITLLVAALLPAVLLGGILALGVLGQSFNIMTLGGMAAAVGLVVDDMVVVLEHIARRSHIDHKFCATTSLEASREILKPLTVSSLATIIVFAPLVYLDGVTGGFLKALAVTMAAMLICSYLVALIVIPLLANHLLDTRDAEALEGTSVQLHRFQRRYAAGMVWMIRRPRAVTAVILACAVIGLICAARVGTGFIPHMDEGGFVLDYKTAPGMALTDTNQLLRVVEQHITALPEVASYSRRTGLQLGGGLTESNSGDYFIRLKRGRRRPIEKIMADLRGQIAQATPGVQVETAQLMEDLIGDLTAVPQPIEVKLYGNDSKILATLAEAVKARLEHVNGLTEVASGTVIAGDAVEIRIDRVRAALEGLDPDAITRQVDTQLEGALAAQFREGQRLIGIRVWTPENNRNRIDKLQSMPIKAPDGHVLPLGRVADSVITPGQAEIQRENMQQFMSVTARLTDIDLGTAVARTRTALQGLVFPPNVRMILGGLYEEQQRSFAQLAVVFVAATLLVAILLSFATESFAVVISILSIALLSLTGSFVGLLITNTEMNITAIIGMTMIVGIVTEIAIFYFAEFKPHSRQTLDDLVHAGRVRLRPVLMTSIIAILALMPLALGLGQGAAMQQPLAIAIIAGLIVAVPLTLLVMPALYYQLARHKVT